MAITLYFAKVNLESEEIYKIYKDSKKKKELSFALLESLQKESCWERMLFFPAKTETYRQLKLNINYILYPYTFLMWRDGFIKKASFITTP